MKKILIASCVVLALTGCANKGTSVDRDAQITQTWSVQQLYTSAQDELNGKNYERAVKLYDILQSRYPNGRYAQQAQLDKAYAYYRDAEPDKAMAVLDNFEKKYPKHENLDYVFYLRGLIAFNEDTSFVNKLASQDWADRDQKANREAYGYFNTLVTRWPDSKYAADSAERMSKLVVAFAGNEMAIARYYLKRGAFVAAVNRAQNVVQHYQNTPFTEEALAIMSASYAKLGQTQLSQDTQRVLQTNFPESQYKEGWKSDDIPWWRYWK